MAIINTAPLSLDCTETICRALIDAGERDMALAILREEGDKSYVAGDGNQEVEYQSETAREAAQEYVDDSGETAEGKTTWTTVYVYTRWTLDDVTLDEDDRASYKIAIDPEEPECEAGHGHEWSYCRGPYGHGGGVTYSERCRHCGAIRHTDTWAQDPEDGEQGLTSVRYDREGDE